MLKRIVPVTVAVCLGAVVGFTAFGVLRSTSSRPTFQTGGYVLQGGDGVAKHVDFEASESYTISRAGYLTFRGSSGEQATVRRESFIFLNNSSVMAMSPGILLDFNDLSDNFINNYYITAQLPISSAGGVYTAETTAGTVEFGEHLWKLSEQKYLIEAASLQVHFSDDDVREVENYVQVSITDDGIVQLLTQENLWMTISEECYIQTGDGVKIYPVTQLVESNGYKLSLAKLAVSADDSIVLTEDETRRQIVPELNIQTIDGESGADGEAGESGREGQDGEKGEIGEDGRDGEEGQQGKTGENGRQGVSGKAGEKGVAGAEGAAGKAGSSGSNGADGRDGDDGSGGGNGENGKRGADGKNGGGFSTTNTALPTMSITKWMVDSTSLKGTISIVDENSLLDMKNAGVKDTTQYLGHVTLENTETGEVIPCYQANNNTDFKLTDTQTTGFPDFFDKEVVHFATNGAVLEPDTSYQMSVVAYYKVNDTIYSREFVSRVFYTDSTGVYESKESVQERGVSVNTTVSESYQASVKTVEVLLLDSQQNLTCAAVNKNTNYTQKYILTFKPDGSGIAQVQLAKMKLNDDGSLILDANKQPIAEPLVEVPASNVEVAGKAFSYNLPFTGLASDTRYVVRTYVETESLKTMTEQQLEMVTLKPEPTWGIEIPRASYNRVTGGFEAYRPPVTDPKGAVKNYVYIAETRGIDPSTGAQVWEEVGRRTLQPSEGEPAVFYIPTSSTEDTVCRFRVEMEYNDNEKNITRNMGTSNVVEARGASLPAVLLDQASVYSPDYDKMEGTVIIKQDNIVGRLTINASYPLELNIYADQVYDRTFKVKNEDPKQTEGRGTEIGEANLDKSQGSSENEIRVRLDLLHLYKNTNYTITVTGYMDVGDGTGAQRRALGTVGFRTKTPVKTTALWESVQGASSTIASNLRLAPIRDGENEVRVNHAMEMLKQGQVTVSLYSGTGAGRVLMGTAALTEAQLEKVYHSTEGLELNESFFGNPNLTANSSYTLTVTKIEDVTYKLPNLSYVNEFDPPNNASFVVTSQATPPDLLNNPNGGVLVNAIYNSDGPTYGVPENPDLPETAIIGYTLDATYDNVSRLGTTITYYAMEAYQFYNALRSGSDPLRGGLATDSETQILMSMTREIEDSDKVPGVAVLFGTEEHTEKTTDADAKKYNDYRVYWTGQDNLNANGHLTSGMDRGYRYVFAYTVQYSLYGGTASDQQGIYPYSYTKQYGTFMNTVGAGTFYNKTLGAGTAYILNSGMVEAPKIAPTFHTYVYDIGTPVLQDEEIRNTMTIHYSYADVDGAIQDRAELQESQKTKITWKASDSSPENTQFIKDTTKKVTGGSGEWFSFTCDYIVDAASAGPKPTVPAPVLVRPTVDVKIYMVDYREMMRDLAVADYQEDTFYLCEAPVEWDWGKYVNSQIYNASGDPQVAVTLNLDNLDSNFLRFEVRPANGASNSVLDMLKKRVYALRVVFNPADTTGLSPEKQEEMKDKTFYLNLTDAAGQYLYADLPTAQLGTSYVNCAFLVNAAILYDNGNQGWKLLEPAPDADPDSETLFAMQYINTIGEGGTMGFSNYRSNTSGGVNEVPSGALARQNSGKTYVKVTAEGLRTASFNASKMYFSSRYLSLSAQSITSWSAYLYADHHGVDAHSEASLGQLSGHYVVPKGVTTDLLKFVDKNGVDLVDEREGAISGMTPSLTRDGFVTNVSSVAGKNLRVQGFEQADMEDLVEDGSPTQKYVLHMALYENRTDALNLAPNRLNIPGNPIDMVLEPSDGAPDVGRARDYDDEDNGKPLPTFNGLGQNKTYYVVFYMMVNGKETVLMDGTSTSKAVYGVNTRDGVHVSSDQGVVYSNTSYFAKQLDIDYTVSITFGMEVAFNIYSDEGCTDLVLSYEELIGSNPQMLTPPNAVTNSMHQTIYLTPNIVRNKLRPGNTYYLKISAIDSNAKKEAGIWTGPFTIDAVSNYGAMIYTPIATADSIEFQVTISDGQYSFMGKQEYENGLGLYAVRFVEKNTGKLIRTKYDNQYYSLGTPKQTFVLNKESLSQPDDMSQWIGDYIPDPNGGNDLVLSGLGKEYEMRVYAIADNEHNGQSKPVDAAGNRWTWDKFFGLMKEDVSNAFNAIIDRFWDTDRKFVDADKVEKNFLVASKSQFTTNAGGIYINKDGVTLNRVGNRLRLTLAESFGIMTQNGKDFEQTFKRIEWDVTGITYGRVPIHFNGTCLSSNNDNLFSREPDDAEYDVYNFDIPQQLERGSYTIVLQLYKTESDVAPFDTISRTYRD